MGRSRFPGKPFKFQNRKRISVLLNTVHCENDSASVAGKSNEEAEGKNENDTDTPKIVEIVNREDDISIPTDKAVDTGQTTAVKTRSRQKMQVVKNEVEKVIPAPAKKTVTFGSVESCSDTFKPLKKVPLKSTQPLVSIIKKKSALKTSEQTTFYNIVKPAKLTDLGSKSCLDFSGLRARHNKSPPVKKSAVKFSQLGDARSVSPPPRASISINAEKDVNGRKFVLPSYSAHSSRVIKPNKRFIDAEDSTVPLNAGGATAKVLKKPKLILNQCDVNNSCHDEAYETCDSSANSNDSSDSKQLPFIEKSLGLFGSASTRSISTSFQDTFANGLKGVNQVIDSALTDDGSESLSSDIVSDNLLPKSPKDNLKDGISRQLLQSSRNTSETPCTSDQSSSSTSESSESEESLMSSESEEDSAEDLKPAAVDKSPLSSQLLSGKVILREARLQLNTSSPSSNSADGPFSAFGSNPSNSSTNLPGTVTCGVCGAVRFYRFVRQARKFGIYSCESCRKFISKMIKKQSVAQNTAMPQLQCLKGEGNCHVPPIVRSQHWKLLRCAYKARCHACWLKMCIKAFQVPAPLKSSLYAMLPLYMRPASKLSNAAANVGNAQTNPLRPNSALVVTAPSFAALSGCTDSQENDTTATVKPAKAEISKKIADESQKIIKNEDITKPEKHKPTEETKSEDNSESNRKRRHARIKVRKKDKVGSKPPDSTKRQKMELKGPRVKHVCRSASIVLGQPIATFPYSEDKNVSDISDAASTTDGEKQDLEDNIGEVPDLCYGCDPESEAPAKSDEAVVPSDSMCLQSADEEMPIFKDEEMVICKDDDSCNSFESVVKVTDKENLSEVCAEVLGSQPTKNDSEAKPSDIEQPLEIIQKKYPKAVLGNISNIRVPSKILQQKFNQQRLSDTICTDFWESYDPDEVCMTGWGLIGSAPFTVSGLCFLCGSRGKEKLIHCSSCCEPYHPFCAEGGLGGTISSEKESAGWLCTRCVRCSGCSSLHAGPASSRCHACRRHFHAACLSANRPVKYRSDWPQICSSCLKCKSCDSFKVSKFLGNLPFCSSCFRLRQKGNYCPLCQGCYQDNDFDSKMMECGWCSRWVHARCEGLSGEGYQLVSALPHSVEYICRLCMPEDAPWRNMLGTYLRGKLLGVLKALAKNKKACALLKLTPHKSTPLNGRPCVCVSPVAVRKLMFDDNSEKSGSLTLNTAINEKKSALIEKTDLISKGVKDETVNFDTLTPEGDPAKAKGTVHKLQESVLQNNEICLSVGPFESADRAHNRLKEKYCIKDCHVQVEDIVHPDEEDQEVDTEDETSSSGPRREINNDTSDSEIGDSLSSDSHHLNRIRLTADSEDDHECPCSGGRPAVSPSLREVKMRVNANEYFSVKDFNRDMLEAVSSTAASEIGTVYRGAFAEAFPWFNCDSNCLDPSLEIEDDDDSESIKDDDFSDSSLRRVVGDPFRTQVPSGDRTVPALQESCPSEDRLYDDDPAGRDARVCVLCKAAGEGDPAVEGRLLYCGQSDWIHANCALWSAEVFEEIDGSLQNVQSAVSRGRMIRCPTCSGKGASVGCCAKNCSETYHFRCARLTGCAFLDDKRVFCPAHIDEAENKALQKNDEFELARPVYVELDKKKKKYCEPQKAQFLLGSLTVKHLGRIIPSVSDFDEVLVPVDFMCGRFYWSSKRPLRIVEYTIRTKLLLAEPSPGFDSGVNITLDHSGNSRRTERILAEIGLWHRSLEGGKRSAVEKARSPLKLSVSLEDLAVKRVVERMLDAVCRQDQPDDPPEEEPQNTADLLPPELKDAIFEDLNHDLLDGISMQDIFPKLMSYEDMTAIDPKNEIGFNGEVVKDPRLDKVRRGPCPSGADSEPWPDGKTTLEDFLTERGDGGKELKKCKTDLLNRGRNSKATATSLTPSTKKSKISTEIKEQIEDRTSNVVANPKSDIQKLWQRKPSNGSSESTKSTESPLDETAPSTVSTKGCSSRENEDVSSLTEKNDKSDDASEQVIDFYTKIHCSPISQLDGADDDYPSDRSDCDSPLTSPPEREFSPILQLDGAGEDASSSSCSEGGSPPRDQNTALFFTSDVTDGRFALTVTSGNTVTIGPPEIVRSRPDDSAFMAVPPERTVRCDRCHCTYRTEDSFNRHLPTCDMMSTSESEGETPRSPESRTLTTLQNAFGGTFAQPTFVAQTRFGDEERFGVPEPVVHRRNSANTRQITINGTIVETGSPGPPTPPKVEMGDFSVNVKNNFLQDMQKNYSTQGISQPQYTTPQMIICSPGNQTIGVSKAGTTQNHSSLPYSVCVKANNGTQQSNSGVPQMLSSQGHIQAVLSSNPNRLLTISAPHQNVMSNSHNKNQMQTFSAIPNCQTVSVPINSLQGLSPSISAGVNTFTSPHLSFQNAPAILMPANCTRRMAVPNVHPKIQTVSPQSIQKSPKKPPPVQPKPVFQAARGRGRATTKMPPVKRQTKPDKPILSYGRPTTTANGGIVQFQQSTGNNQPSIIVQQMGNNSIVSAYVEALQQQQGQNVQYIATIAPQGDYKPTPSHYISQGGMVPQTFQIQQTESGGLVAVPSGGIPVFLPQGGVGILPQGTIQTANGTSIINQSAGLSQGNISNRGPTLLSQGRPIVQHNNVGGQQTALIPQSALQSAGNTVISQPGTTVLPAGAILPQGLQFCNDRVLLGSTPALEMVTDSSGCVYLTTQPVYYGLETIVQNTVMSSQQFVSTAMQGVLAQNSSFSATTTQVFQASKIEPIVEMPAGYVVVNNDNMMVSQPNVANSQTLVPAQTISGVAGSIQPSGSQKTIKTIHGPNIAVQPSADKFIQPSNGRQMKPASSQPNRQTFSVSQPGHVGAGLSLHSIQPRNITVMPNKQNVTIQPMQSGMIQQSGVQIPVNSSAGQCNFSIGNLPIHIAQPTVSSSAISSISSPIVHSSAAQVCSQNDIQDPNRDRSPHILGNQQHMRHNGLQPIWRTTQNAMNADTNIKTQQIMTTQTADGQKFITTNMNNNCQVFNTPSTSGSHIILSTSVNNSRSYTQSQFNHPIFSEASSQSKGQVSALEIDSGNASIVSQSPSCNMSSGIVHNNSNSVVSVSSTLPLSGSYMVSGPINQQMHSNTHINNPTNSATVKYSPENTGNCQNIVQSIQNQQLHQIGNNDGNNMNKSMNIQMIPCGIHRNTSAPISDGGLQNNQPNMNVLHLPSNMTNLSLQGEKMFHVTSSNNSASSVINSGQSLGNGQNQIGCNVQMHVNNVNRPQSSIGDMHTQMNINQGQIMNSSNGHMHVSNNNINNNQMQCMTSQMSNSCNQHQIVNNNIGGQQQIINNVSNNQHQLLNSNGNHHQLINSSNIQFSSGNQQILGSNASNNQHQMLNTQMHNNNGCGVPNQIHIINNSSNQMQLSGNQMHTSNNLNNNICNSRQLTDSQIQIINQNNQEEINNRHNQIHMQSSNERSQNQMNNHNTSNHLAMHNNNAVGNQINNQLQMSGNSINQIHISNGSNQMQIANNANSQMQIASNSNNQIQITNNSNNQLQIGNNSSSQIQISNNPNNQMQIGNNANSQMQMVTNSSNQIIIPESSHEMSISSNSSSQYRLPHGHMNDQIFLVNSNTPGNHMTTANPMMQNNTPNHFGNNSGNAMNPGQINNNVINRNQLAQNPIMNQNVQQLQSSMHHQASMKAGTPNHNFTPKGNSTGNSNDTDTVSSLETESLKIGQPGQSSTDKQLNPPVLSIQGSNQIGYIHMNSGNNQILNNYTERNQNTSISNSANGQMHNQISQSSGSIISVGPNELITLPRNMINLNASEMQPKITPPELQSVGMPIININNGSLTIPPLLTASSKQINLPQHNLTNNCIAQTNKLGNQINLPIQNNVSIHNTNIVNTAISLPSQSLSSTINLPTQSSSSITLPKAPPHQSGIPTNVVNPIPQSMRPMNRVLPIHRDAQTPRVPRPKTKVEPPKPAPRSQDMPDLNVKDEEMVVDSDLNKAIIESKAMLELEEQKKTEALIIQTALPNPESSIVNTTVLETGKTDELQNVNRQIPFQNKSQNVATYKAPLKNMKEKENISTDLMKPPLQKIDFSKLSKEHANALKIQNSTASVQRKIQSRSKLGLENTSNTKLTKQHPSGSKIPKDDSPKLIYEVSSDDGFNYSSTSLTDLWSKVLEAVQNARKQQRLAPLQCSLMQSMAGTHILGLHNNALKYLIEQLPGTSRCIKYKTRHGCKLPSGWELDSGPTESLKESQFGSARVGPAVIKACPDMFSWLASPYRDPPPPLVMSQDNDSNISRRLPSTALPMAMRFRNLKETSKQAVGVYRSHIHGRGLFCRREIDGGEMVIEYAGEVIRAALADQRERRYEAAREGRGVTGCYMFRVDDHLVVDATMKGNAARFINHSCDPNCYSRVVDILGHKHILIFALRRINQGEELTYDYKFPFEEVKIPCTCGAKKCRKYLN